MSEIKKMLQILGLERSGNKAEVVDRLMAFMLDPQDRGLAAPKPKKKVVCDFVIMQSHFSLLFFFYCLTFMTITGLSLELKS